MRAKVLAAVARDSPLCWQEAYAPLSTAPGRRDFRCRNFYIKYMIDGRSLHFRAPPPPAVCHYKLSPLIYKLFENIRSFLQ